MDKQEKFFNKQYISTRIGEFREIKRKEITFNIDESDRVFSKTLYVNFYCQGENNKWFKECTLRISDHSLENSPHTEFIVEPNECLTKKKKAQFMRTVELCIRKARTKHLFKEMKKIEYRNQETV